jgi:methyltransferase (TIGR00027 family)
VSSQRGEALPGVSRIAVWLAGMRADESTREDRLFDDRLAGAFAAAAGVGPGGDEGGSALPAGAGHSLAIRTRFFDDQAMDACAAGIKQVVLLAAGLDSRAFRLDWPDHVRLFELDLPEVFEFKEPVLIANNASARCERVVVPVDLREDWVPALRGAGFDPATATLWLAEGLLPYLTHAEGDRLLAAVGRLSTLGSHLVLDHLDKTAANRPAVRTTAQTVRNAGAPFMSMVDSPVEWLANYGWHARIFRIPALTESYGRTFPPDADMAAWNVGAFLAALR